MVLPSRSVNALGATPDKYILRFTQNTRCPETGGIKVAEWSRRERIEVPVLDHPSRSVYALRALDVQAEEGR